MSKPSSSLGSISTLVHQVNEGSEHAMSQLWERLRPGLLKLAKSQLTGNANVLSDEEDAALTAFYSFVRRAADGSYSQVVHRDDLWRILTTIIRHKAANQQRMERRRAATKSLSANPEWDFEGDTTVASDLPTPESTVIIADLIGNLLNRLKDDELREIAVAKLAGHSNQEIATRIGRSIPTVERRLRLIRDTWRDELAKPTPN